MQSIETPVLTRQQIYAKAALINKMFSDVPPPDGRRPLHERVFILSFYLAKGTEELHDNISQSNWETLRDYVLLIHNVAERYHLKNIQKIA